MQALDNLLGEIEEAATLPDLEREQRLARLRSLREDLAEALEDVDDRIALVEAEPVEPDLTLAVARLREAAEVRKELIDAGTITEADADADGVLSHAELDAMQEEGILEAAARELVASGKLVLTDEADAT